MLDLRTGLRRPVYSGLIGPDERPPVYRRTREAMTVREWVNRLLAPADGSFDPGDGLGREKAVIVFGDLNDELDAATTQILQGPASSEIGTGGFSHGDRGMRTGSGTWHRSSTMGPMGNRRLIHPTPGSSRAGGN